MPVFANAVWQTARPAVAADTAMPEQAAIGAPPSLNVTVPPSGDGATFAVNVTAARTALGLRDETNDVVVAVNGGGLAIV